MYSALHPSIGVGIGHKWSLSSRLGKGITKEFLGEEKEDLIRYAKSVLANDNIDYFIIWSQTSGNVLETSTQCRNCISWRLD